MSTTVVSNSRRPSPLTTCTERRVMQEEGRKKRAHAPLLKKGVGYGLSQPRSSWGTTHGTADGARYQSNKKESVAYPLRSSLVLRREYGL